MDPSVPHTCVPWFSSVSCLPSFSPTCFLGGQGKPLRFKVGDWNLCLPKTQGCFSCRSQGTMSTLGPLPLPSALNLKFNPGSRRLKMTQTVMGLALGVIASDYIWETLFTSQLFSGFLGVYSIINGVWVRERLVREWISFRLKSLGACPHSVVEEKAEATENKWCVQSHNGLLT